MVKHRLDPEQKDTLVREGLANPELVSKLCAEYNVSRSSYYRWRNDFLLPRRDREDWVEEFIIYNCKEALPPKVANCLRQVF